MSSCSRSSAPTVPTPPPSQSISSVTGGGLTWTLRKRANTQAGTAEIWQAVAPNVLTNTVITATRASGSYQGAITVAAFIGADTIANGATASGAAATGAPYGLARHDHGRAAGSGPSARTGTTQSPAPSVRARRWSTSSSAPAATLSGPSARPPHAQPPARPWSSTTRRRPTTAGTWRWSRCCRPSARSTYFRPAL